jgi:hypothetical protein
MNNLSRISSLSTSIPPTSLNAIFGPLDFRGGRNRFVLSGQANAPVDDFAFLFAGVNSQAEANVGSAAEGSFSTAVDTE